VPIEFGVQRELGVSASAEADQFLAAPADAERVRAELDQARALWLTEGTGTPRAVLGPRDTHGRARGDTLTVMGGDMTHVGGAQIVANDIGLAGPAVHKLPDRGDARRDNPAGTKVQ
jgi:hypothetical protein